MMLTRIAFFREKGTMVMPTREKWDELVAETVGQNGFHAESGGDVLRHESGGMVMLQTIDGIQGADCDGIRIDDLFFEDDNT